MIAVKLIVYKCQTSSTKPECLKTTVTPPGSEPRSSDLLSNNLPLRHTFLSDQCTITLGEAHTYKKNACVSNYSDEAVTPYIKTVYFCNKTVSIRTLC